MKLELNETEVKLVSGALKQAANYAGDPASQTKLNELQARIDKEAKKAGREDRPRSESGNSGLRQ